MEADAGTFSTVLPDDWLQGRTAFGGLSAALCWEAAQRADDALREAVRAIGERAGWIIDPERREFFLTCVPAHCRIVEMASAAGIDLNV